MSMDIFKQVFNDAVKKMPSSRRQNDPETPSTPRYEDRENNLPMNLTKSTPFFANTPAKPVVSPKYQRPVTRAPKTPQSARVKMQPERQAPTYETDIRVYLRIRPLLEGEEHSDFVINENTVVTRPPAKSQNLSKFSHEHSYTFTKIFEPQDNQEAIFNDVAMPLLIRFIKGVDSLLFTYGATSAGKTYTVQGTDKEPGLLPRMVKTILSTSPPPNHERGLFVSCVEVYNERIHDLLGDSNKTLRLSRDGYKFTVINGVTEEEIHGLDDLTQLIKRVNASRRQCSTMFNANSSRSHCVFMLKMVTIPMDERTGMRIDDTSQLKCTRLSIVDLAGSERVTSSETNNKTISEACNINKSMLVLGRCIREMRRARAGECVQVPFRESKLTELFRDFFEPGNRKTAASMIVNISPSTNQFDDTIFSLSFAEEAVECSIPDSDDDFNIHSIDFDQDENEPIDEFDEKILRVTEARIREEIHNEMSERLKQIQNEYQNQLEQIRIQSQQPYTSKLQQALAQRMQSEGKTKELDEINVAMEREKQYKAKLEKELDELKNQIEVYENKLREATHTNTILESNIQRMIEATKLLHSRHLELQQDLETKMSNISDSYSKRAALIEQQINQLKGNS